METSWQCVSSRPKNCPSTVDLNDNQGSQIWRYARIDLKIGKNHRIVNLKILQLGLIRHHMDHLIKVYKKLIENATTYKPPNRLGLFHGSPVDVYDLSTIVHLMLGWWFISW